MADLTDTRIPIAVLTGFLGSGKTTVLRHLSQLGELKKTLILVNEFGEVGLDHDLLSPIADDTLVAINAGCICCTIRTDLAETLSAAPFRYARGGERWFDRVIIETTGIADPAPVLQTILGEPSVNKRFVLASVVTTVDAVNGLHSIDAHPEALKQVAVADRVLLTKTDLLEADQNEQLLARVRQLAPSAPVSTIFNGAADVDWLFADGGYELDGKHPSVERWLQLEHQADKAHRDHEHDGEQETADHDAKHDRNRHGRIEASCLTFSDPVDPATFEMCLQSLKMLRGADLLRIKGIINVMGMDKPMVIHGVQHVFHPPEILEQWPGNDRRTRIVMITRDLDHLALQECFANLGLKAEARQM